MGGKKPVDKSREWEKERREKLNVAFNELFKLLPDHDPSISLSKVDILRKAAEYIRLLQEQNDEIIKSSDCHVLKNEADRLKKRVAYLLLKTKELVTALRDAGVPVPKQKAVRKRKKNNSVKGKDQNLIPSPSASSALPTTATSFVVSSTEVAASKAAALVKKGKCGCLKDKKSPLSELNPTNRPGTSLETNVTVVGPTMLSAAVQAIPGLIDKNTLTPTLGPGTLIFRDGRIVTVPSPAPLVPQILVNTNAVRSAVFVMQTPQPVAIKTGKFAHIAPKRREVTQTTFTNSAPIPAIKTFRLEPFPASKSKAKKRKSANSHCKMSGESVEPAHQAGKVPQMSKGRKNLKRKGEQGANREEKVTKVTDPPDKSGSTDALRCSTESGLPEAGVRSVDERRESADTYIPDQSNVVEEVGCRVESKDEGNPETDGQADGAQHDLVRQSSDPMETSGGISSETPVAASPDSVASIKEASPVLQPSIDTMRDTRIISDRKDLTEAVVLSQGNASDMEGSQQMKPGDVESGFGVPSEVNSAPISQGNDIAPSCQGNDIVLTVQVTQASSNVGGPCEKVSTPQEERMSTLVDACVLEKNQPNIGNSKKPASTSSPTDSLTSNPREVATAGATSFLNGENEKLHEDTVGSSDFGRPSNDHSASSQHKSVTSHTVHLTNQQHSLSYHDSCQKMYQEHAVSNTGSTDSAEKVVNTKTGNIISSSSSSLTDSSTDCSKLRCSSDKGTSTENGYSNVEKAASRPPTACDDSHSQQAKDMNAKAVCAPPSNGAQSTNEIVCQSAPSMSTKVAPVTSQSMVSSNKQTLPNSSLVGPTPKTLITSNTQMYPIGITGSSDMSRPENLFNYDTPLTDPFFSNFMGKPSDVPIPSQNSLNYNSFTTQAPPGRSVARQLFPSDPLCSITNSYSLLSSRQNDFDGNIPLNSSNASQMFQFSTYSSTNSFRDPPLFPNDFLSTPTKSSTLETSLNDKDPSSLSQPQNFPESVHSSSNANTFPSIACNFNVSNAPVSGSMCISGDSPSNSAPFTIQHNKQCPVESLAAADSRSKQNSKSCGINGSFSMNVITSNAKTELKSLEPPYQKSNEAQSANFHYLPPASRIHSSQIAPEPSYHFTVPPPSAQPPNSSGTYNFHAPSNSTSGADKNTRKNSQSVTSQKPPLTKDFNLNAPANGSGSSGSLRDSTNQYQSNSFHNPVCEQYANHPSKGHHPVSNVNMANFNNGGSTQQSSNNQGVQTQQSYLCNNSSSMQLGNQNTNQLPPGSQSFPTHNTAHHLVHSDKKYPKVGRMSQDAPYGIPSQQVMMKPTSCTNTSSDCNMPIHPQKVSYQHSSGGSSQETATISFQNPRYSVHNVFSHSDAIGQKAYQGQMSSYRNLPNSSVPQSICSNPISVGSQYTASTVVTSSHTHNGHSHNLFSHMNVSTNIHTSQTLNNSNYGSSAQLFPNVDTISQHTQDNRNHKSHSNVTNVQLSTNKPPLAPQGNGQFGMQNMKVSHVGTAPNFSMSNTTSYQLSAVQSRNGNQQPITKQLPNQTSLNLNYSQTPNTKQNVKNDGNSQYPPASMNTVPPPPKQCDYPLASILTGLNDPMLSNQLVSNEVAPNERKIPDSTSSEKNAACGDKVIDKQYSTNTEGNTFKADSVCNADFLRNKDNERNSFIPIIEDVRLNSDFSNDLFSSLQVPTGGAHSDSISPTAAFLLAFPLVSTSKNTDNLHEVDQPDNNTSTPTTILQIGNIDPPNSEMFQPLEFGKEMEASEYLGVQDKCKRKDTSGKQKKQGMGTYPNNYSYPSMSGDFNIHCDQSWGDNQDKNKQVERKKNDKSGSTKFNNGGNNIEFCKQDKKKKNKISVNWMAVPEANETYSKEAESSSYPAANSQFPMDMDGLPDLCSSKKNNGNVYSWSPSKTLLPLDSSLMIPSTLPTLVGDLALGTTTPSDPYNKRCDSGPPGQLKKPLEKPPEKRDAQKSQNNFLSVSQLVDPKSKKQKLPEAKCKKSDKKKAPCQKRKEPNDPCMYPDNLLPPIGWDKYRYRNNYSAEALIGTQDVNESLNFSYQQNPAQAYFVGPEVNQEHSQQYQNSFNFTQNQFTSFVAEEFQSNNFSSSVSQPQSGSAAKRSSSDKREGRCRDETSNRFLGNATAYQQPPPLPYASTALTSSASHPSHFTSNTTTSVTNFNLSTIFPEINERTGSQGQAQQGQQHNSAQHPHPMNSFSNNSSNNYRNHNL